MELWISPYVVVSLVNEVCCTFLLFHHTRSETSQYGSGPVVDRKEFLLSSPYVQRIVAHCQVSPVQGNTPCSN